MKPGTMSLRMLLASAVLSLTGVAQADASASKAGACTPTGELRGDARRGAPLHLQHCAGCHGVDGKSEVIVMHMDEPPKDQSDPAYMKTLPDEYIYLVVCKGGAALGKNFIMPKFGDVISDQDIRDLIAWIRTFSGT
jgi:cytochrome c oxidase cbb3-type subunit 3